MSTSHSPGPIGQRVAAELRAELGRQNKSRRWLAEQINVPHNTVSRWVGGETCPPLDGLSAMCDALCIDMAELMAEAKWRNEMDQHRDDAQGPKGGGRYFRRANDFQAAAAA